MGAHKFLRNIGLVVIFSLILMLLSIEAFGAPAVTLNPTVIQGQNALSQSFHIQNAGGGKLNYTITGDAAWLYLGTVFGAATDENNLVVISYDTTGLAVGTYKATITISDPAAQNSPQIVEINLTVTASPEPAVFGVAP